MQLSPPPAWLLEEKSSTSQANQITQPSAGVQTQRLQAALADISADDYSPWINVGFALKQSHGDAGLDIWREWSATSSKYNPEEIEDKWKSFSTDHPTPLTEASIFHLAKNTRKVEATAPPLIPPPEVPQPLRRSIPAAPEFPLDALPEVLRDMVALVVEVVQVPPALAGQSALAAACLAVQARANATTDGRTYPLSNFFVTVGETGERKSASDRIFLAPHHEHQRSLAALAVSQGIDFKIQHAVWKKRWETVIKKRKMSAEADPSQLVKEIGDEPIPPRDPMYLPEEPTYEGLIKLLDTGQPSVGLFSDEGARLIGGHAMSAENQLKTVAGFSKLWDGDAITRSRSGDGHRLLFNRRLSIHLMIQPAIMPKLFGNSLLAGQGFLSRILCAYPSSTIGTRMYNETDLKTAPALNQYNEKMHTLLTAPSLAAEDPAMGLNLPSLHLTAEAKKTWKHFHNWIEKRLGDGQEFAPIRGLGAKGAEHALRLAGTLTLIDDPKAKAVTPSAMVNAVQLVKFYLAEGLRLFGCGHDDPDLKLAEDCLDWGRRQGGILELTRLYQRGPNQLRNKTKAMRIIQILVNHGWLEQIDGGLTIDGRHHNNVWQVIEAAPC